jgi:hypothetical protein
MQLKGDGNQILVLAEGGTDEPLLNRRMVVVAVLAGIATAYNMNIVQVAGAIPKSGGTVDLFLGESLEVMTGETELKIFFFERSCRFCGVRSLQQLGSRPTVYVVAAATIPLTRGHVH